MGILSLDSALAAHFIKILYVVALILIVLGVLARVGFGVARIVHPPMHRVATAASVAPTPSVEQAPPSAPQAAEPRHSIRAGARPWHRGFDRRRSAWRRFGGPRFGLLGVVSPSQRPLVAGILRILGALIWGAIAILVVRVLAELANAVLTLEAKPKT